MVIDIIKECRRCNLSFPLNEKYFYMRKKTGKFEAQCKECIKKGANEYVIRNVDKVRERRSRHYRENKVSIMATYKEKYYPNKLLKLHKNPLETFQKSKKYRDDNKEHIKIQGKEYRKLNAEKVQLCCKNYRESERGKALGIEYRKRNSKKRRSYEAEKLKNDIQFKLKKTLHNRILGVLKLNRKSDNTIKLIGCSTESLKNHLELLFLQGMSWENHGEWHIDHIVPCVAFDLSIPENQRKCFNYKNLQPLWAIDNLRKSISVG